MEPSIFLDFSLPTAATWFYFSVILTVALFFQFAGVLSVRNLDLLSLFLLVPGFLLLQEANGHPDTGRAGRARATGYVWLLAGSGYWFVRAVVDLVLVRRPVLRPNLTAPGLGFLGLALFVCLGAVAVRRTNDAVVAGPVGTRPIPIEQVQNGAAEVVRQTQTAAPADVRFWVERGLAMACHLAVVLGLFFIGWRHFGDLTAGMAAGTLYLLIPYTAYHIGQYHLAWPAAFVTWAVYCYRRPVLSGWLLGIAAGTAFVPLLLLPLWAGCYAGRGAVRFVSSFVVALVVSVGVLAVAAWWGGWLTPGMAAATTDWLPWRRTVGEGLWAGVHGAYRLPVFLVYLAFALGLSVWPTPKNLSHLIALSAAVLLGVQFWHPDGGGVYVLWYLPLLLLMVFRPTLTAHEPPVVVQGEGRVLRWAWRQVWPARAATPPKELAV